MQLDEKSRINLYTLGKDNRLIFWKYTSDRWIPKVWDMKRILKEYGLIEQ